ncbi:ABC transporter, partial [Mesotoga sp. SC_3PWM13N19]
DRDKLASCRGSSIRDNLVIQRVLSGGWVVSGREMDNYARELLSKYGVVFGSIGDPVFTLSGGNLQKLLLAREISSEPKLLLLGEPFRGLDVRHLEKLRSTLESVKEKMAIVIFTSDLDEALIVADRVVVMSEGRIVFSGANGPALSKRAIGEHFAGTLREDRR